MKKLVITLASVFILSFNFANAISSMNTQNVSTNSISMLSSADSNMLFGGEANAIILDNQEMKNTQGFGFWSSLGDFFKNPLNDLAVIGVGTFCVLTAGTCVLAF